VGSRRARRKRGSQTKSDLPVELARIPSDLLAPVIAADFARLRISVSIWAHGVWRALHLVSNVSTFEVEHGGWPLRHFYNERCLERVCREKRSVIGEHGGFLDLFVPVINANSVDAVLVAGPVMRTRATGTEVRERWHKITHSHGHLAEPDFFRYLEATLATVVFEGPRLDTLQRLLECFAKVVSERGMRPELAKQAAALQTKLDEATFPERMWDAARSMIGRLAQIWSTPLHLDPLASFGLKRPPRHVIAGLLFERSAKGDPTDSVIRSDAFQRACVGLAKKQGRLISGRVGRHGVTFLVDSRDTGTRLETSLLDVASRAGALARRFGFSFHAGLACAGSTESLADLYQQALGAAEQALSRKVTVAHGERMHERFTGHLRELRAKLGQGVGQQPSLLTPRFDRYVESVLLHSRYHVETVRQHLEAGLEWLLEPLAHVGAFDARSFDEMWASAERAVDEASTIADVVSPYRQLVADVADSLQNATAARHDRTLRRALAFIRGHLTERMTVAQVASAAGFAPAYFSKLLKHKEGVAFERYVRQLRVVRAKHMLADTPFAAERIAHLCGFGNRTYFHRAFKSLTGMTPREYRAAQHTSLTKR
jgi:AraC-like DNA-binding protein